MFSIKKVLLLTMFTLIAFLVTTVNAVVEDDEINYDEYQMNALLSSNRFTQMEADDLVTVNPLVSIDDYTLISENTNLRLYLKSTDLSIRIEDKESGYIWGSSFNTDGQRLNKIWRARVDSAVWITYFRKTNVREEVVEESITTSENSTINTTILSDGFTSHIVFGESGIELTLTVKLSNEGIIVSIPNESIVENETNRIGTVRVYPFMGAVKATDTVDIPGYVFLPDGSGALMRFNPQGVYQHLIYSKAVYLRDDGLYNYVQAENLVEEPGISIPLFGIVHGANQNAFYARMIDGDGSARIVSYPAGRTTDFYFTFFETIYRIQYEQPTSRNMGSVVTTQPEKSDVSTEIEYVFLNGNEANYVGMANSYHDQLVNETKMSMKVAYDNIPIRLEFLMRERKKGLLFDTYVDMTSADNVKTMIETLTDKGVLNQTIVLRGWSSKGYTGSSPNYSSYEGNSGKTSYLDLYQYLNEMNYDYYLNADYMKGYVGAGDYSLMVDLARKITGSAYSESYKHYDFFWLHPESSKAMLEEDLPLYDRLKVEGLALESLGRKLYSSHGRETFERYESILAYQALLEEYEGRIALYQPSQYAYSYLDSYFDSPMYSSLQVKFTDTVPFVQIALRGLVDLYGVFTNFSTNYYGDTLRMIDYGIYPSFILTEKSATNLLDTPSEYLSSTQYSVWEPIIIEQYSTINSVLKTVEGARLINRIVLQPGVVKNIYNNGVIHYINYSLEDVTHDSITISSGSSEVVMP